MTISSRTDIGILFETVNRSGFGVEIGVERGWNAINILKDYTGILICVDIWEDPFIETEFNENTYDYRDRIIKVKLSSQAASKIFNFDLFDFVYIDALHDYNSVQNDYFSWSDKVADGGIIAFHDYGDNEFDVKKFVDTLDKRVRITTKDYWEGKEYQTAYFYK
jgi:predicted O-methyltransferase YrrM